MSVNFDLISEDESNRKVVPVILSKYAKRQLQEKVISGNLSSLLSSVNTRALTVRGWVVEAGDMRYGKSWKQEYNYSPGHTDYEYEYKLLLNVIYTRSDRSPEPNELPSLLNTIAARASQPSFGRWSLKQVNGEDYTVSEEVTNSDQIGYASLSIPDDWQGYFDHLYGLDSHIERVKRALEAGVLSSWNNRYHCALVGPPGCGKSDICQSIKRALGEEAVIEFDATSTTAAGAIKELSEREILPRVLLVEEIEKADEKAMSFLLSVLDLRSQIRKTTARASIIRDTKLFAIATVNDVPLFEKLQAGALASRFSNTIWFQRPSREQLALILNREVTNMDGDPDWITPTLDYCEKLGITDPRTVTAICLCGRDMLLTGEYQKMLENTSERAE